MRVLITGGAGFVGSNLADRLLAAGHEVLVIDDCSTGRWDNLADHDALTTVEASICDLGSLGYAFEFRPDVVVHAAASYKDPDDWWTDARTNTVGTANIVKAAEAMGTARIVYFQTALCYGTRPDTTPIGLDHPIRPDSSYAISKTAGEQYIEMSRLDYVSLRLANCYGPRNLSGPLPTFYRRLTNGEPVHVADSRRDFVFVDDLLDVVEMAIEGTGHGAYHVSSGADRSIKELFDAVCHELGIEVDVRVQPRSPDDAASILLDPSRTYRDFGWMASTPLEEGVREAVGWYKTHEVGETYTHLKLAT